MYADALTVFVLFFSDYIWLGCCCCKKSYVYANSTKQVFTSRICCEMEILARLGPLNCAHSLTTTSRLLDLDDLTPKGSILFYFIFILLWANIMVMARLHALRSCFVVHILYYVPHAFWAHYGDIYTLCRDIVFFALLVLTF